MTARLPAVLACSLLAAGCGGDGARERDMPDASTHVSYARDVQPIFARCVICHHAGGIVDLDLTDPFDPEHGVIGRKNSWADVHESPFELVVEPGDPDASFLIYKVEHDPDPEKFDPANNGDPMPMQVPRVTESELADIRQWIRDGAKDDTFFTDKVATVLGSEITLGGKRGKCTLCHYPGSSTGLDILAVFDSSKGLVGAKSLLSKKLRVAPGAPDDSFLVEKLEQSAPSGGQQMPLHYERLSQDDVETLRAWIEQGAKDD
ncbi:MAG TPA: hypothetical protein VJV78_05465 [Polyangiales bacterium]|nr:hypothetical protein [Polyangiales bacterium]